MGFGCFRASEVGVAGERVCRVICGVSKRGVSELCAFLLDDYCLHLPTCPSTDREQ